MNAIFDATLFIRYQEIMILLLTISVSSRKEAKLSPLLSRPVPARFGQGENFSEIQVEFFIIDIFCITGLDIIIIIIIIIIFIIIIIIIIIIIASILLASSNRSVGWGAARNSARAKKLIKGGERKRKRLTYSRSWTSS